MYDGLDRSYEFWNRVCRTYRCGHRTYPYHSIPVYGKNKPAFMILFPLLIAYIFSDLISQISLVMLGPDKKVLSRMAVFCESLFSSILIPMLTWYLLKCAGNNPWKSRIMYIACVFLAGYIILLAITQFTTIIYYITEDNIYHRGPLYPVLLLSPALLMLLKLFLSSAC